MKHKHHIIQKHAGGTNDPENLIELTVEEHALAHKALYEKYGRWQDYLAWMGLSGMIGKEQIIQEKNRMCHLGKKPWNKGLVGNNSHFFGVKQTKDWIDSRMKNLKKKYRILTPSGEEFIVDGLNEFCRKNNLTAQNLCKVALGKRKHHKGYKAELI
jgi:hypothetical protein